MESAQSQAALLPNILILVGFALVFYFLLWRPQSKRAKEQRELMSNLTKGDEVITNGGVLGKITKISSEFLVLDIAEGLEIKIQKSAVSALLPKGTLKSI